MPALGQEKDLADGRAQVPRGGLGTHGGVHLDRRVVVVGLVVADLRRRHQYLRRTS